MKNFYKGFIVGFLLAGTIMIILWLPFRFSLFVSLTVGLMCGSVTIFKSGFVELITKEFFMLSPAYETSFSLRLLYIATWISALCLTVHPHFKMESFFSIPFFPLGLSQFIDPPNGIIMSIAVFSPYLFYIIHYFVFFRYQWNQKAHAFLYALLVLALLINVKGCKQMEKDASKGGAFLSA